MGHGLCCVSCGEHFLEVRKIAQPGFDPLLREVRCLKGHLTYFLMLETPGAPLINISWQQIALDVK